MSRPLQKKDRVQHETLGAGEVVDANDAAVKVRWDATGQCSIFMRPAPLKLVVGGIAAPVVEPEPLPAPAAAPQPALSPRKPTRKTFMRKSRKTSLAQKEVERRQQEGLWRRLLMAFDARGAAADLGRELGVADATVPMWKRARRIPPERVPEVEAWLARRGWAAA